MFIGNIQAAGTGLTLVGPQCLCSDVFFVEASYAVGDNVQAAARVHRIGQKAAVVARFLTAHGTIDDRIQDILARKAGDFAKLFN
jgi:SNF2 family DNA or RNA helicase